MDASTAPVRPRRPPVIRPVRLAALLAAGALVAALLVALVPAPPAQALIPPGSPAPNPTSVRLVTPGRYVDTRAQGAPLGPGETRVFDIPDGNVHHGPAGTQGYAVNVTAVGATQATHLTAWPYEAGAPAPATSILNVRPGETRAAFTTVRVTRAAGNQHDRFFLRNNSGSVHVLVDVYGYVGPTNNTNDLSPVPPRRLVDTRSGTGLGGRTAPLGPGETVEVDTGDGINVTAVMVNLTAVAPTAATHLTAWEKGVAVPPTSALNVAAGEVTPNVVLARVDDDGRFLLRNNSGHAHVLVDLIGLVTSSPSHRVQLIAPQRLLDTRTSGPVGPGGVRSVLPHVAAGVPEDVDGVLLTVTAVSPTAPTHLTTWTYGTTLPGTSTVNAAAGQTVANAAFVRTADLANLVNMANHAGQAHIVVDIVGWTRVP